MCATNQLFRADIGGSRVYKEYLKSFPLGTNEKFRDPESSEHNCNYCNNFIKRYGNIVAIIDGKLESIFNVEGAVVPYNTVANWLNEIKSANSKRSIVSRRT